MPIAPALRRSFHSVASVGCDVHTGLITDISHIADIVLGSKFRGFGNRTRRAIPLTHWSIHICEMTWIRMQRLSTQQRHGLFIFGGKWHSAGWCAARDVYRVGHTPVTSPHHHRCVCQDVFHYSHWPLTNILTSSVLCSFRGKYGSVGTLALGI